MWMIAHFQLVYVDANVIDSAELINSELKYLIDGQNQINLASMQIKPWRIKPSIHAVLLR